MMNFNQNINYFYLLFFVYLIDYDNFTSVKNI